MRAALYLRISRDDTGEGLGIERQEQDCRQVCARRGWSVTQRYADNDISAYSGRFRPGYTALLHDLAQQRIDAVVSWAPERLHRSPRELEDFIELVERSHVQVETVKAGAWDVSTSHGRLVARMLGAVSRAESERTGERVSRAHQQAKQAGRWRGPIPYGMRPSGAPGLPEPDETQAPVVLDIFTRLLRGDALVAIARDLNTAGIKPRRGTAWTHTGIDRLVSSPALGGLLLVDGELRDAAFKGVIAPQQWREAQAALKRRPRGEKRRPRDKLTLLGGILRCERHGVPLWGGSGTPGPVYTANTPGVCYVGIKREPVDEFLRQLVVGRLTRPDARGLLRPDEPSGPTDQEVAALRSRRDELATLIGEGLLNGAAARTQLESIAARLAELEQPVAPSVLDERALIDPEAAWEAWSMPQRREAIRILFAQLSLKHAAGNGPRADVGRLAVTWARDKSLAAVD